MKWTIVSAGNHVSTSAPRLFVRHGDKGWFWVKGSQKTRHGPFRTATLAKTAAELAVFPPPPPVNEEE